MMLFQKQETNTVHTMLDKFAIKELIEFERFCRDNALWDQMKECYAEHSHVCVSWYKGDGYGFVQASSKMLTAAPHRLYNTLVWVNGNRAVAVCMACIQTRTEMDDIKMDLSSYVRLVYTVIKEGLGWKIVSLNPIYEKDCLVPVTPAGIQWDSSLRESYVNLANIIGQDGYEIDQNLPGDDQPTLKEALLIKIESWLNET